MFEIDKNNLTKNREGYLFVYAQIAFNQLRRYANLQEGGKSGEGWRKYTANFELEAELLECKILGVLSTSLFLEAYIFDYSSRKSSTSFTKTYLDKLDPLAKWVIATRIHSDAGLDPGTEVFARFKQLLRIRNSFVHHKTRDGADFSKAPAFPNDWTPEKCLKLMIDMLGELKKVDPGEDFADFILQHINSWFTYSAKDSQFYPILWEA